MDKKVEQAVILSAGLGTRLRPLTDNMPKVMVPILDKPLLEYHVEQLVRNGVTNLFVNLHYLPNIIRDHFGDGSKWGAKITYNVEPTLLGTAGGVKEFEKHLGERFFVVYGDVFSMVNYSEMASAFLAKKNAIGMSVVGRTNHPHDSDLVEVDDNLIFVKIYPKPHTELPQSNYSMKACHLFSKRILEFIPPGKYYEIDHQLLPKVITKKEAVYGYRTNEYLMDIGTLERYLKVQEYVKSLQGR